MKAKWKKRFAVQCKPKFVDGEWSNSCHKDLRKIPASDRRLFDYRRVELWERVVERPAPGR